MKLKALLLLTGLAAGAAWAEPAPEPVSGASSPQGASAAADAPPAAFKPIPGLAAAAPVAGMSAWITDSTNVMFFRDETSGALIAGFAFDADGNSLHPALSGQEGTGFGKMLDELFPQTIEIPEQIAPTVEERLSRLSEGERKKAVASLIAMLRGVEGEAAFNAAIATWLETLAPVPADAGSQPKIDLIDAARDGFWMQIGDRGAPVLYVITDPSCEPCRASTGIFRDKIEAGELQLRVLMVNVVDENSLGTIAGIAAAEDPAAAFMVLTLEDGVELPSASAAELPEAIRKGISSNYRMAEAFQIPELPFFAFETPEGPQYIAGAPSLEQVSGALPPEQEAQPVPPGGAPISEPGSGEH